MAIWLMTSTSISTATSRKFHTGERPDKFISFKSEQVALVIDQFLKSLFLPMHSSVFVVSTKGFISKI